MINKNIYFEPQSLLSSFDNSEEYSGFQLFGIGKPSAKQIERRKKRKEKHEAVKKEFKGLSLKDKLLNLSQKFNPAAALPRSSALVGVRVNVFGIATRLYPALLTEQELKSRNFNLENAKKSREAWEKVKKVWIGLGGATPALEKAIRNGYDKPVFKTKKAKARKEAEKQGSFDAGVYELEFSNYTGAEETAAYISIGISLLAAISAAIGKSGASKNPYDNKQIDTEGMDSTELTPDQKAELERVAQAAADDLAKGKGLDSGDDSDDKILGLPKAAFWIGTSLLAVGAVALTIYFVKRR